MGLFGKLFEKKTCAICGNEIGMLGNKKLEDGNCCKDCANQLSPWFNERRHSTVEDIKAQLEYRDKNRDAVRKFHTTRTLGRNMKVYLDDDARKFMVTAARNLEEANPDVLSFTDVTGCDLDVRENRTEDKREIKKKDGTSSYVSYNPPHYTYSYDFKMTIHVNHPYFDEISYNLNNTSVRFETVGPIGSANTPKASSRGGVAGALERGIASALASANADPRTNDPDYNEYLTMGQEIKDALTKARRRARKAEKAAAAPKAAVTCPYCGATTVPDASGCCEYCGGSIDA